MSFINHLDFVKQIARFGMVGGLATLVHAGVGYSAVTFLSISGLSANVAGFAVSWWVSFFGHHAFTFEGRADRTVSLMRFIPHSLALFGIGMTVTTMASFTIEGIPEAVLPVIGAFIVPVVSFLSSKFIVFRA